VTEIVDGTVADATMTEFRMQEAAMGAQVTRERGGVWRVMRVA
jgi:hypothetical protein